MLSSTRHRLTLAVAGLAVLAAACFPLTDPDPPPADAPDFPGYPPITRYLGIDCHTVLLVGDSMMTPNRGAVASTLADSGRCANVINTAVNGTAPAGNLQGVDWSRALPEQIAAYRPDALVMEFVGNGFTDTNGEEWLAELQAGLLDLVRIGTDAGVKTFVAIPPDVSSYPEPFLIGENRFIAWQRAADLGADKIDLGARLSPTGWTAWLKFPDGIKRVRTDFVHVSDFGAYICGYTIAAGIQNVWAPITPASPPAPTTEPPQSATTPEPTTPPSSSTTMTAPTPTTVAL